MYSTFAYFDNIEKLLEVALTFHFSFATWLRSVMPYLSSESLICFHETATEVSVPLLRGVMVNSGWVSEAFSSAMFNWYFTALAATAGVAFCHLNTIESLVEVGFISTLVVDESGP